MACCATSLPCSAYVLLCMHASIPAQPDYIHVLPPVLPLCCRYEGFIRRQARQLASVAAKHAKRLPVDLDYRGIDTLSMEAREKLSK